MGEVDTVKVIKKLYANFYIQYPFLEFNGLNTPTKFIEILKSKGVKSKIDFSKKTMEDIIEELFENKDLAQSKRYSQYQQHSVLLLTKNISEKGFIPLCINGLSVSETQLTSKGRDPFSNNHFFTTQLIDAFNKFSNNENELTVDNYSVEFLEMYKLIFIQPVTYIAEFFDASSQSYPGQIGLQEINISELVSAGKFGTLNKYDLLTPTIGNSSYNKDLFSTKHAIAHLRQYRDEPKEQLKKESELKKEIELNKHLMAIKLATIFDKHYEQFAPLLNNYNFQGIPIYAEKTSDSAKILELSKKYSSKQLNFYFIGDGILSGVNTNVPRGSISNSAALRKLFRMFDYTHNIWKKENNIFTNEKKLFLRETNEKKLINYVNSEKFPGILIEEEMVGVIPNIETVIQYCLNTGVITNDSLKFVTDFAYKNKIGFSRLEPRLVELFTQEQEIYTGLRSQNKTNKSWLEEIKNKEILTPKMIEGFFEMNAIAESKGEFRGSELAMPAAPRIDDKWLDNYWDNGTIDVGCSLQKIVSSFRGEKFMKYLVSKMTKEELEEFNLSYKNLEPIAASRGTAIHEISSVPLEGLKHYETLEKIGLKNAASDDYAEMPLIYELKIKNLTFTASMHPDCLLFLKDKNKTNEYDILILDTKSNRKTDYPEHKYLQQTYFYSWFVKKIVEENLGMKINNFYNVLNKNSFHKGFMGEELKVTPHSNYRSQKFSPITLWEKDHYIHEIFPNFLHKIITEKRELQTNEKLFAEYKKEKEKCGYCKKCYLVQKKTCELIERNFSLLETTPWED